MGGNSSTQRSVYYEKRTQLLEATTSSIMNCKSTLRANQSLKVSGKNNNLSGNIQNMTIEIDMNCVNRTDVADNIKTAIKSAAKHDLSQKDSGIVSSGGIGNSSTNEAYTHIESQVENIFTTEAITNLVQDKALDQEIGISGTGNTIQGNIQDLSFVGVIDGMNELLKKIDVVNNMDSEYDAKMDQTSENPISEVVDSTGNAMSGVIDSTGGAIGQVIKGYAAALFLPLLALLVVLGIIYGIYSFASGGSGEVDEEVDEDAELETAPEEVMV
jgi:hypothetical protein